MYQSAIYMRFVSTKHKSYYKVFEGLGIIYLGQYSSVSIVKVFTNQTEDP